MKVTRSFALDLEDMKKIETTANEKGISENKAVELLVRHGFVRIKQLDQQFATLAPDNSDLR